MSGTTKSCITPIPDKTVSEYMGAFILPTSIYELIPVGKGVGLAVKGSKKVIGVFKNRKDAQKALEKAKINNNVYRDDDLISRGKLREQGLKDAREAANNSFKPLPKEPRNAIQEFFGKRGHEGLDKLQQNFKLPEHITSDALKKYRAVAENQIKRGGDKNGVQKRRLEFIDRALKELGD